MNYAKMYGIYIALSRGGECGLQEAFDPRAHFAPVRERRRRRLVFDNEGNDEQTKKRGDQQAKNPKFTQPELDENSQLLPRTPDT